jgi:crotonobetainyl-CoA:carnitine CoA-transferase CaiB-like acyl-CoA transferase
MQAESGLMDLTGEPSGPPARLGAPSIIDQTTGLTGAIGLLAGIIGARATGAGCDVDTSLFDVALHQLGYAAIWSLNEADTVTRQPRSAHFSVTPVQTFPTADGWVFIMCMTEKFWLVMLEAIGAPELAEDPRFADAVARHKNRQILNEKLDAIFGAKPSAHWLSLLRGRLPIAPVLSVEQALRNPLLAENDMIRNVPHPTRPDFRMLANPLKINGQRLSQKLCSAVGEDNAAILQELAKQEEALK